MAAKLSGNGSDVRTAEEVVAKAANALCHSLGQIEPRSGAEEAAYTSLAAGMDHCLAALNSLGLWGEANRLLSSIVWNACEERLSWGWLQNRARSKPRGYAGDYELLSWIYERRLSDNPLGRLFDRYFQDQAAPQAVRNRMTLMSEWIVTAAKERAFGGLRRPLKIGFVGSALGLEIRDACLRLDEQERQVIHAVLVDVDPDALEFARRCLGAVLHEGLVSVAATNLFRLPQRPGGVPELAGCDLLFCPGLIDYLDDSAAAEMLAALHGRLNEGGRLVVFQFAPHNPTRAYMEWFGNWYLIYRDAEQLRRLVEGTGDGSQIEAGAEALGIDLWATITKPANRS